MSTSTQPSPLPRPMPVGATPMPDQSDLDAGIVSTQKSPMPVGATPMPDQSDLDAGIIGQSGARTQPPETMLHKVWRIANTPGLTAKQMELQGSMGPAGPVLYESRKIAKKISDYELRRGNPFRSTLASYAASVLGLPGQFASGITSPLGAAMTLLPEVKFGSVASKLMAPFLSVYFGETGLKDAFKSKLPGETDQQYHDRQVSGAVMALAAVHGAGASAKDIAKSALESHLGLSSDHAAKVAEHLGTFDKINKMYEAVNDEYSKAKANVFDEMEGIKSSHKEKQSAIRQRQGTQKEATRQFKADIHERGKAVESSRQSSEARTQERLGELKSSQAEAKTQIESSAALNDARRMQISDELDAEKERWKTLSAQKSVELTHAISLHERRLGDVFDGIASRINKATGSKSPITGEAARELIVDAVTRSEAKPGEIPKKALASLPQERKLPENTKEMIGHIIGNKNPTAAQAEAINVIKGLGLGGIQSLSFRDLTRLRTDLYHASFSADDNEVSRGLTRAAEQVTSIQDEMAYKAGVGGRYKVAKTRYLKFMREIGKGPAKKMMGAYWLDDQVQATRVLNNMTDADEAYFRELSKSMGVDMSDYDSYRAAEAKLKRERKLIQYGQSKEYGKGSETLTSARRRIQEAQSEIDKINAESSRSSEGHAGKLSALKDQSFAASQAHERQMEGLTNELRAAAADYMKQMQSAKEKGKAVEEKYPVKLSELKSEAKESVKPEGDAKEVVPGVSYDQLRGMTNDQLRRMRIEKLMRSTQRGGIGYFSWRMAFALMGLGRMMASQPSGAFEVAIGLGPIVAEMLMKSKAVTDWVAEEGGIENRTKFRHAYLKAYPVLRRAARQAIIQAVLGTAMNKSSAQDQSQTQDQNQ